MQLHWDKARERGHETHQLLLLTGSLVIALFIAESVVRFLVRPTHLVRFEETARYLGAWPTRHRGERVRTLGHRQLRFNDIMRSDPERFWKLAPGVNLGPDTRPFFGLVSNQEGLREDHEIEPRKAPNEVRVLFLGDSCTYGYLLDHTQSFVDLTERALQHRFPDKKIECINAGVPGYTLFQGWRYFETEGLKYEPDLVVLNFGLNDLATWDGRSEFEHYEHWRSTRPPRFLRWSRLAEVVWTRLGGSVALAEPAAARPRVTGPEYRDLLEKIATRTNQLDAGLLLVIGGTRLNLDPTSPPGFETPSQMEARRFARILAADADGLGGAVDGVAIAESLSAHHPVERIYFDNVHPTSLTNAEVARHLETRISTWLQGRL